MRCGGAGGVLRWFVGAPPEPGSRRCASEEKNLFLFFFRPEPDVGEKSGTSPERRARHALARRARRVPGARGGASRCSPRRCATALRDLAAELASSRDAGNLSARPREAPPWAVFFTDERARPGRRRGCWSDGARRWTSRRTRWRGTGRAGSFASKARRGRRGGVPGTDEADEPRPPGVDSRPAAARFAPTLDARASRLVPRVKTAPGPRRARARPCAEARGDTRWRRARAFRERQSVRRVLAEIETDKATVDFEMVDDGIVAKILRQADSRRRAPARRWCSSRERRTSPRWAFDVEKCDSRVASGLELRLDRSSRFFFSSRGDAKSRRPGRPRRP